jgi:hypothetical protein
MAVISIKNKTKSGSLLVGNAYYVPPAFESIATATGTGSSGTITFSSIPATYTSLQIRWIARDNNGGSTGASQLLVSFNSDTTSTNYRSHSLYGNGASAFAASVGNRAGVWLDGGTVGSSSLASTFAVGILDIHDYANTSKNKTTRSFHGEDGNGSSSYQIFLQSGLWMSTSAITSITVTSNNNFTTTSQFSLYGIKGA